MEIHLQVAGVLQLALALAHLFFPRLFGWRQELQGVSLLTRQIFWAHLFFIALTVAGFGTVSVLYAVELTQRGPLARAFLGGLSLFWLIRWIFQFFFYSSALWRGHRFNTVMHVLFGLLWMYLFAVYGTAFARQW